MFAVSPPAQQEPVVTQGKQLAVQFHRGKLPEAPGLRLSAEALEAAESRVPAIERLLLIRAAPATIHVHADPAAYRAIEKQVTGAQGLRNLLVDAARQEAHVLLRPQLAAGDLELVGLPRPTQDGIVRAVAQLLAAQKSRAAVADPWLGEVFAWAVLEGAAPLPKPGVDPWIDSRRWHLSTAVALRTWVMDPPRISKVDDQHRQDAVQCMIAQLISARGDDWARRWLQNPLKATESVHTVREGAVERILGRDWTKMRARWESAIKALDVPFHVQSPMLQVDGKRWLFVGSSAESASMTAQRPLPEGPYRIAATCEVRPDSEDLRLELDWDSQSLLGVFLKPGAVELDQWVANAWHKIASSRAPIVAGKPFDVAVEVGRESEHLTVVVDGERVLRWRYSPRTMRGPWSIANNNGVAWIQDLRAEAIQPK